MTLRADETGFGGIVLLQDTDSFCYGVDAVLLADYSRALASDRVLDLCCGNGAVAFIIRGKYGCESITGVEVQRQMCELAEKTARLNGLSHAMKFLCGDVLDISSLVEPSSYSLVTCNPPYIAAGSGPVSGSRSSYIARHETTAVLGDFVRAAAYALKPGGRFCMVHRPGRLVDVFEACRASGLEPKRLRMVCPRPSAQPNIALIGCIKGGGRELAAEPELCIRGEDGNYSEEIMRIYERR